MKADRSLRLTTPQHRPWFQAVSLPCSLVLLQLLVTAGCDRQAESLRPSGSATAALQSQRPSAIDAVNREDISQRVREARQRLRRSEGGYLIWQAIEAHGGLSQWFRQRTLSFSFRYAPIENRKRNLHTHNYVDLWSARVRQQRVDKPEVEFAFDGDLAWIKPDPSALAVSHRFWARTPYYFVAVPFVFADPGTRFERLSDQSFEGTLHRVIKITFAGGVGDSPRDYYVAYLDPRDTTVRALRYVVTHPSRVKDGERTAEKLMKYGHYHLHRTLRLAHRYDTYAWDEETEQRGDIVTQVSATSFRFGEAFADNFFDPPGGAVVSMDPER